MLIWCEVTAYSYLPAMDNLDSVCWWPCQHTRQQCSDLFLLDKGKVDKALETFLEFWNIPVISIWYWGPMSKSSRRRGWSKILHHWTGPDETHASRCPQRTAAKPHSKTLFSFLSLHSKSILINVLSFLFHNSWIALGSPARMRALRAESKAAGRVECNFL